MEAMALPAGLADIPPGPELAAALAGVEPARVANRDLLVVLRAQARQAAHDQARLLAVIAEVARAEPVRDDRDIHRSPDRAEFSSDEVRAALAWSRRAADNECDFAEQVVHELPQVHHAFLAGRLDRPKARVFTSHLHGLTPTQIAKICTAIVPVAHQLTPGQIAARLMRMIIAIDPRHYERRYRKALRDRWVTAYLDENGVAVLTTHGLRPAQAGAALDRIDALARAARTAGHRSTLDQIRVDIVAGLLDGTLHNLDRAELITHLLAHRSTNDDPPPADQPTTGSDIAAASNNTGKATSATATDADADPAEPSTGKPRTAQTNPDTGNAGQADTNPAKSDTSDRSGARANAPQSDTGVTGANPAGFGTGDTGGAGATSTQAGADNPGAAPDRTAAASTGSEAGNADASAANDEHTGVEIRTALSALLGHDQHPGEIPGLGPVTADHAREIVAQQRRAEWRFAILDNNGRLIFDGITRRRPTDIHRTGPPGGIVELHIPATLLEHLATKLSDPHIPGSTTPATTTSDTTTPHASTAEPWDGVVADIARQYADRDTRDLDKHPDDRLPHTALRRHTQIRDRTCIGPGCRHRPARCDQDHTTAHKDGGKTVTADLAPTCRHDHRLKHDGGWQLTQPEPGTFVWTSPLGGIYQVQPEPIEPPLPDPEPIPDDPWHDEPAHEDGIPLILHKPHRPPPAPTPPPRPVNDPGEPAPF